MKETCVHVFDATSGDDGITACGKCGMRKCDAEEIAALEAEVVQGASVREILMQHGCVAKESGAHIPTLVGEWIRKKERIIAAVKSLVPEWDGDDVQLDGHLVAWSTIINHVAKAWKATKCYNESPLELITDVINERDAANASVARMKMALEHAWDHCGGMSMNGALRKSMLEAMPELNPKNGAQVSSRICRLPKCVSCGKVATCVGSDGVYMCDTHCGHGQEDGSCTPLFGGKGNQDV
jgi:hypothetical protein